MYVCIKVSFNSYTLTYANTLELLAINDGKPKLNLCNFFSFFSFAFNFASISLQILIQKEGRCFVDLKLQTLYTFIWLINACFD